MLSQVNALILERLLRTPPFAKLACDPHSAHARLACCLGYIPVPVELTDPTLRSARRAFLSRTGKFPTDGGSSFCSAVLDRPLTDGL